MAIDLTLYKGINPNTANSVYYYLATQSAYDTFIDGNSYKVATITLQDYRINSEVLEVKITETFTETIASTITYARYSRNGLNKYYNVHDYTIQSGYVIFNVTLDTWATYVYSATINLLNVKRCNRNIGIGLYDPIRSTKNESKEFIAITGRTSDATSLGTNSRFDYQYLNLILAIKHNVYEAGDGTTIAHLDLVGINLKYYKDYLLTLAIIDPDLYDLINAKNPLDLILDFINGVYANHDTGANYDFLTNIVGAWIVEDLVPVVASAETVKANLKSKVTIGFSEVTIPMFLVNYRKKPSEYVRTLTFSNLSPNYEYYVGTANNGLKLTRTTESSITVNIKYIIETDSLKVLASQGDNETDITSAFAFNISTVDGDVRYYARLLNAIQSGLSFASKGIGTVASAYGGNYAGAVLGGFGMAQQLLDLEQKQYTARIGQVIKGGDGMTSYYFSNIGNYLRNPYMLTKYESIDNEVLQAQRNGAEFKIHDTTIASIITSNLLGTASPSTTDELVLQATARVTGVPTDAVNAITNLLGAGIRIVCALT